MRDDTAGNPAGPRKAIRLFLFGIVSSFLLAVIFGLPIFLSAATLNFWNGWLFVGLFAICSGVVTTSNPALAEKRTRGMEKENSQIVVKLLLTLCTLAILVLSGLNCRYRWSTVPLPAVLLAALLLTGAFLLLFMVMKANRFASRVVEVQEDQKIIDTGAYAIVRHPMYLAFTILFLASPVVLGSWQAMIPALCIPFLLAFRIEDEEKVLRNGLAGYDLYMKKVKYRLLPYLW